MRDTLYEKYQPTTWAVSVVEAPAVDVAHAISATDPNSMRRAVTRLNRSSIEDALAALEPLGTSDKLLIASTASGTACLFANTFVSTITEYPAWRVVVVLNVQAVFVLREPTTIAPDKRSGAWGARKISLRDSSTPFGKEPLFEVGVINDAGRWVFFRSGTHRAFEDTEAYGKRRATERFTDAMLLRYCDALGVPVFDSTWYTGEAYLVRMKPVSAARFGKTYAEAAVHLRIGA